MLNIIDYYYRCNKRLTAPENKIFECERRRRKRQQIIREIFRGFFVNRVICAVGVFGKAKAKTELRYSNLSSRR